MQRFSIQLASFADSLAWYDHPKGARDQLCFVDIVPLGEACTVLSTASDDVSHIIYNDKCCQFPVKFGPTRFDWIEHDHGTYQGQWDSGIHFRESLKSLNSMNSCISQGIPGFPESHESQGYCHGDDSGVIPEIPEIPESHETQ